MSNTEPLTDESLRTWDWRSDLKADERTIPWLARQTGLAQNTVYLYAWGKRTPQIEWLRQVAALLGKELAA